MVTFAEFIKEAVFDIGSAASRAPSLRQPTSRSSVPQAMYPVQTRAPMTTRTYAPQSLQLPRLQITKPPVPATKASETGAGRFAGIKAQGQPQQTATAQATPKTVPPAVTHINAPTVATGKNGQLSPAELVKVGKYDAGPSGVKQWYASDAYLAPTAAQAFNAAQQAFGRPISISSAYRSLEHQRGLSGEGHAVVAKSGKSRHGLGKALDVSPKQDPEGYNWLKQNGSQFGWQYANIPGDPFHFEYRGAV